MKNKLFTGIILLLLISGCSPLVLKDADFSWPIENVLKVNDNGKVSEERYTFSISVKPLFQQEFADSNFAVGKEIRIIRGKEGYYYITAAGFKNVYLFLPIQGGMKLEEKIVISETEALTSPAFNQKSPNIELLDGSKKYLLNSKGIVR